MKKLIIFSAIALSLSFVSCESREEGVFEESSSQRIEKIQRGTEEVLNAAPNGWSVEYYLDGSLKYGGYQLLMEFHKGEVAVSAEFGDYDEKVVSLYSYEADLGATITFDTYNYLFHSLSEPLEGLGGDFEFSIVSYAADKVVLRGKKNGAYCYLTPVPADMPWDDYLVAYEDANDDMNALSLCKFVVGDETFLARRDTAKSFIKGETCRNFIYEDYYGNQTSLPFVFTLTGIKFYAPATINGVTFDHMDWDGSKFTAEGVELSAR